MSAAVPLPAQAIPYFVRPGFLVAAALAATVAILNIAVWDLGLDLACLGLAVRFFELARFRAVHRSGWLLLLALWSAIVTGVQGFERRTPSGPWLALPAAVLTIALAVSLFVAQRRRHDPTQDGADWPLGGFLLAIALAFFGFVCWPLAFLFRGQAGDAHAPGAVLLTAMCAVLLALQFGRNRWFPRIAVACSVASAILGIGALELAGSALPDEVRLAIVEWSLIALWTAVYLLGAPRVRRTFARRAA
jgi:hypothetical protein